MRVIATAGHVDHGKTTLIQRLTGMQPDRWESERRRGLTIDLGFAWTRLPSGMVAAFVDVPGHERFVGNMLAGVGPVPAVLFVVAADEGWQPQSEEHLTALDALRVEHGLLVVTRSDLADPEPARRQALDRLSSSSLGVTGPPPSVTVSGRTGAGMDRLVARLDELLSRIPGPDPNADVRVWIDRSFTISGAGTVVTGTLPAGRLRTGDELRVCDSSTADGAGVPRLRTRVRGLQALGVELAEVTAPARVAINLRGVSHDALRRGDALVTPGAWLLSGLVDVRLRQPTPAPGRAGPDAVPPVRPHPRNTLVLHLGSAAVEVRPRALGDELWRLRLGRPLPLRVGDRGLLRDPGRQRVVAGIEVLDVRPPDLRRRGSARARAEELARALEGGASAPDGDAGAGAWAHPGAPRAGARALTELLLSRRGLVAADELGPMGLPPAGLRVEGGAGRTWYADAAHWRRLVERTAAELDRWLERDPLAAGMPTKALRQRLEVPADVLGRLLDEAGLSVRNGYVVGGPGSAGGPAAFSRTRHPRPGSSRVSCPDSRPDSHPDSQPVSRPGSRPGSHPGSNPVSRPGSRPVPQPDIQPVAQPDSLPVEVDRAVRVLERELAEAPFEAPTADRLRRLGLGVRQLAAAVRTGRLIRIADGLVLLPGAEQQAAALLAELPQPFTLSLARQTLRTTRRVAVPLLELLDERGITERLPDGTHRLRPTACK